MNIIFTQKKRLDLRIVNLYEKIFEFSINVDSIDRSLRWSSNVIYSPKKNIFIGNRVNDFSSGYYEIDASKHENPIYDFTLYPQPTNGLVILENSCRNINQFYSIYDINGKELLSNVNIEPENDQVIIDLSGYESGIYFLKIFCASDTTTYKIIKEM